MELEKIPQYSKGADLVSYHLKFRIGDSEYYIDTDVGVAFDDIDLWNEGDCIMVYYQTLGGKKAVILAMKEQ